MAEWGDLLTHINPAVTRDEFLPQLADQLAGLSRTGHNAAQLLARRQSLPGLSPTTTPPPHSGGASDTPPPHHHRLRHRCPGGWVAQLDGHRRARHRPNSSRPARSGPPSSTTVDEAVERGWRVPRPAQQAPATGGIGDPCIGLLHRIDTLTGDPGVDRPDDPPDAATRRPV